MSTSPPTSETFCAHCGTVATGGRFCTGCGQPIALENGVVTSSASQAEVVPPAALHAAAARQVAEFVEVPGRGRLRLATIGQRFVARLLDVVVVVFGYILLWIVFTVLSSAIGVIATGGGDGTGFGIGLAGAGFLGLVVGFILVGILGVVYEVVLVAVFGRTVGKMILSLRLVREIDGRKPNWGNATLRWIAPGLAYLVPFLGGFAAILVLLSPIFDGSGRRQGWHDKMAGTLVVATR